ncbi:MAG: prepilin-type N-terminal cleavage/methylation domain-containing protein [Planctomycetota bacterium]
MSKHSGLVRYMSRLVNRDKGGFTLVELLVVIAVIALLMAVLLPALTRAREMGKRAVCLYRLEQLMLAWFMYADNNDDKIVCGDAEEYGDWETRSGVYAAGGDHYGEMPWTLDDWSLPMTIEEMKDKIRKGALFRYTKDTRVYKCPTGKSEKLRMYSVVDSMNVTDNSHLGGIGAGAVMIEVRQQIRKPYERFVFFDDGGTGPSAKGGWTVRVYKNSDLNSQRWWDPPPIRHGEGTTFSFADGHTEYHKWRDKRTIDFGLKGTAQSTQEYGQGNEDLIWSSIGVWGSPPVDRN